MTETGLVAPPAVGTCDKFPAQPLANVQIAITNADSLQNAGHVVVFGGPSHGKTAAFANVAMMASPAAPLYWGLWISVVSTADEPAALQRILVTSTAGGEGGKHLAAVGDNDNWPPPWFGAIQSDRPDTAARTEEILRAEFGQNDHR
jgi:hypothetical protein